MSETPEQAEIPHVKIYTDGACHPNPGPGGYSAILIHPKKRLSISGGFRLSTNNRMEILAAIAGLERLRKRCKVTIYSDSQYLVNAITKGWATRWRRMGWWRNKEEKAVNCDLWERLLKLCAIHQVTFVWVRGHSGNVENERCDELCCAARRKPNLPIDEGYENKTGKPDRGARAH